MLKKYDLTQGDILRKLLLVATPIMGMQLMQMSYNLVDMFFLGLLPNDADAVAASGTAGMFLWLSMAFLLVGRMGAEIGVSQHLGRNDRRGALNFAQNAVFLALVLGVSFSLLLVLGSDLLISFFQIEEAHVAADAAAYLSIVGLAMPLAFITFAVVGIFNGSGNSRLPFRAIAAGLAVNIALDPVFIFALDMGVQGAAVATALAQTVSFSVMMYSLKKHKERPFEKFQLFTKPDFTVVKQLFKWTVPISCESLFFTMLTMVITRFVTPFGSDALAVMRVGGQLESLSWLIGGGFGSAIAAFTGQNFGAGKWQRITAGRKLSTRVMFGYGIFVTLVLFFFGRHLFSIFLSGENLRDLGATYLRILAFCQIAACLEGVSAGVLRGMGKTLPPSIISISANVLRVPLAYALSITALGLEGIWIGVTIGAVVRGLAMFIWCWADSRRWPKADAKPALS